MTASTHFPLRETVPVRFPPALVLCVLGVLLPNLIALGAHLYGIGLPPRGLPMVLYALLVLAARRMPPILTIVLFPLIVAFDAVWTISAVFHFSPLEFVALLHLGGTVALLASPLYAAAAIAVLAIFLVFGVIVVAFRTEIRQSRYIAFLSTALCVVVVDALVNTGDYLQFKSRAGIGRPMESGTAGSGFLRAVREAPGRNVLVIVVESLGVLKDEAHARLIFEPLRDPRLLERYVLTSGESTFFGGTANGELRELCQTRASYGEIAAGGHPAAADCLPNLMTERGYDTLAVHAFGRDFYDRSRWYPQVGFARSLFLEDMAAQDHAMCGSVFRGPCDTSVLPLLDRELREAKQPLFAYWLTLTTHVPVATGEASTRLGCGAPGARIADTEVCAMAELWVDLFQGVRDLMLAHGPMEVVLVGDHGPPLWRRAARRHFENGKVPWLRLAPIDTLAELGLRR